MSTLTSNGSLSFSEIETEYDVYSGPSPFGINGYYDADPYHDVPVSGTISVDDLRGTSKQTVRIEPEESADSAPRYGYSSSSGSSYYVAESGESSAAFGQNSRTFDVVTNTTDMRAIVGEYAGYYQAINSTTAGAGSSTTGTSASINLLIAINTSTNTGWSNMSCYCDSMPVSPGSTYNPWGGGSASNYAVSGYNYSAYTVANTVYTVPRTKYMTIGSTTGYFPMYHFKSLSNTSPTAYGYHFSQAYNVRYNSTNNTFYTGHQNKHRHAAQMLYSGARADTLYGSSNEVYFYFY